MRQETWSEPWGLRAIWIMLKTFPSVFMRRYSYWRKRDMNKFPSCNLHIFCNNYSFPPRNYIWLISSPLSPAATDSEGFTSLQLSLSSRNLSEITALHFKTGICFYWNSAWSQRNLYYLPDMALKGEDVQVTRKSFVFFTKI